MDALQRYEIVLKPPNILQHFLHTPPPEPLETIPSEGKVYTGEGVSQNVVAQRSVSDACATCA